MHMKDDILAMWKSRDTRKTSSLGPMFISSADSRGWGSTLGQTFIPGGPVPPSGMLHGPGGGGMSAMSSSAFKPVAPPPGIPLAPGLSSYLQQPLASSFPAMGPPAEYNFDPITGRPLKASTPNILSQSSNLRDVSASTSISPRVTGQSNLPRLSQEECPLVVGPLSCSSRVVVGGRVPTVTMSSSAAKTTLSLSNTAPMISTSSSNVTGGDAHRVILQHPTSSPSRALAGAGVGRGARRPTKRSTGRGQGLASLLMDKDGNGVGRGQSVSSPPVRRSEQDPAVTYLEATSRPPRRTVVSSTKLDQCDVQLKVAAQEKEKEAA